MGIVESNSWPCTGDPKIFLRVLSKHFCDNFPEDPVQVFRHTMSEKPFLVIQPKPLLTQLEAISSIPVTGHHRQVRDQCLPLHFPSLRQLQSGMRFALSLLFCRLNRPMTSATPDAASPPELHHPHVCPLDTV